MEKVYQQNMAALHPLQPYLASKLNEVSIITQDRFVVFQGLHDDFVLKVKNSKGNYILYNSFYNPYKEAQEITSSLNYDINRNVFLVIGAGMGYQIKEILEKINKKSILLIVEKDIELVKNLLHYMDLSEEIAAKKIIFIVGYPNEKEFNQHLQQVLYILSYNIFSIQPQLLPIYDIEYIRYSKEVIKKVYEVRDTYFFKLGNDLDDTLIGIDNRLKNLPHMIEHPGVKQFVNQYKHIYQGKPAVIIASGPSLDKNIKLLKEIEGKALLLACDASMESLKKHQITPDVVGSVERIWKTYEAFYKDKEMPEETVLVAPAVVRPEIFKMFKNKTLSVFKSGETIAEWFNKVIYDKGRVWSGASVAHVLMGFALELGSDPIILVGQDLAYSMDGKTHASEVSVKKQVDPTKATIYVKDIYGNQVPTEWRLKKFLDIFEEAIRRVDNKVIDATEGGAYIEGTEIMTLRETIDQYCYEEIPRIKALVDDLVVTEDEVQKAYHNALRQIIRMAKRFHLLREKSMKGIELNQEVMALLQKGITEQEELDMVYDAIEYTEHKVVRHIMRNRVLYMLYQYPIHGAASKINPLGTKITFEVLEKNLEVQKELLDIIKLYAKKALHIFNEDFEQLMKEALQSTNDHNISTIIYPEWLKFIKE